MVNKLFIMLPVMLASRKLDAEDQNQVFWLRLAYGIIQSISVLVVLYTYIQATSIAKKAEGGIIYVPPAPQPFADPNAKKKYTEISFGAHVLSTARSLLGSTLFGICMTVGLHLYKGMIAGVAMQTVMGPLNLIENPLVKALLFGTGIREDAKIFDEKTASELTPEDEVVDGRGEPIVRPAGGSSSSAIAGASTSSTSSFEEILLDTWDAGNKAEISIFMSAVNKKNCNFRTKESGWTPLMILSGLTAKGTASAIRQVKQLGGNPAITDEDGWNCLHWAAFHGSIEAAKELAKDFALLSVKDKEGKLPLDMAKAEGNEDVAKFLESCSDETVETKTKTDGIRKRK